MEIFCPGWKIKDEDERLRWINNVLYCNPLEGKPQYDIHFSLSTSDEDYEYAKTNAPKLFENFMKYNIANIQHLYKNSDTVVLSYSLSTQIDVSNSMEIIKYFVVGAFLGLVLGIFLILMPFIVNSRERSKA
jgi:hypothetical protein